MTSERGKERKIGKKNWLERHTNTCNATVATLYMPSAGTANALPTVVRKMVRAACVLTGALAAWRPVFTTTDRDRSNSHRVPIQPMYSCLQRRWWPRFSQAQRHASRTTSYSRSRLRLWQTHKTLSTNGVVHARSGVRWIVFHRTSRQVVRLHWASRVTRRLL